MQLQEHAREADKRLDELERWSSAPASSMAPPSTTGPTSPRDQFDVDRELVRVNASTLVGRKKISNLAALASEADLDNKADAGRRGDREAVHFPHAMTRG